MVVATVYGIFTISNGYVYYDGDLCRLMDINGYDRSFGVRPIVTLKSDVQLEANGENNWKIK